MLNVNNIIKSASMMLSVEELKNIPDLNDDEMTLKLKDLMLYSLNEVLSDLCTNFFPLIVEEEVALKDKCFYFEDLKKPIVRLYAVKDDELKTLAYQKFADHIRIYSNLEKVTIRYSIMPSQVIDLNQEINDIHIDITEYLVALGVATEFCLIRGKLSEATIFDQKYKDAIESAKIPRKSLYLKNRNWF